jgi:RHS repeat-associated protein
MSALTTLRRRTARPTTLSGRGRLRRAAPIWLGLIVTVGSAIPPASGDAPWLPILPEIPVVSAGYPCSSHSGEFPLFTGKLSDSSGATLNESTTGNVYGRITNVDERWQPSPGCGYYRYDGVIWATDNTTADLTVHWGALSGDMQYCNYTLDTFDYLHANDGACPSSGTTARLTPTLTPEWTYQNDVSLDNKGDFAFAHSDCTTWYNKNVIHYDENTGQTTGKPGVNCGYKQLEGTGTSQTLVVDGTAPSISFTYPAAGGPVVNPAGWTSIVFSATDVVAGFGGTDDWDLQRQIATWDGTSCLTFGNDSGTDALVSGTTNATNQVRSQSLALNKCYRWTLGARDQNGNTATTITSGTIRTATSCVWGDQPQFRMEGFDLGAGDTLAVSVGSGNVRLTHPIVSLPIRAGALDLTASYNSHDTTSVGLGPGWRLNVQRRLFVNTDNTVSFRNADGSVHKFTNPTGTSTITYTRPATLYATLTRDTTATPDRFTLTYRDQSKDIFDEDIASTGLLKQIKDRHGNTVSLTYYAGAAAKINKVTDPAGREVVFTWDASDRLTQIVDWVNVSGGIVQTSGSGNRTHRFFYDTVSPYNLLGWSDPLNTSGSCPTAASHRTCLTYASGFLSSIVKTQTYETISGAPLALGSATRTITTSMAYTGADVTSVTDAEGAATTFTHPSGETATPAQTLVTRPGTPQSKTAFTLVAMNDTNGRIGSVKQWDDPVWIETETTYDATYPIEPATVKENKGGGSLERVTSFTYHSSTLGLLFRLEEPLDGSYARRTEYTYNANNDVTRTYLYSTDPSTSATDTRYCYTTSGCPTSATDLLLRKTIENYVDGSAGGTNGHVEDITTSYEYDTNNPTWGLRIRETRSNYQAGGTLLDSAATGWTHDTYGNVTAEIRNYSNGGVACPSDDTTPNGTTNARTDLTTTYTYDTGGNLISSADPRRAIAIAVQQSCQGPAPAADDYVSRTVYDALNQAITTRLPTTPGQTDCGSPPACREATTTYDELGLVREAADLADVITATQYDKVGRPKEIFEDTDGAGSTAAAKTSSATYDGEGRVLTSKDRRQLADSAFGDTDVVYDSAGQVLEQTSGDGTSAESLAALDYDALGQQESLTIGEDGADWILDTTWDYDAAGNPIETDDEFTCTSTTTYDYRGLPLIVVEGQAHGSCSGGIRTITNTYDGLGRLILSQVTNGLDLNDKLVENIYDSAGNLSSSLATRAGVTTSTTFTVNPLDEVVAEVRSDGTWTKTNYDPVGGPTDRCLWVTSPGTELCKAVGQTFTTNPTTHTTASYDARDSRVSLQDAAGTTTTAYDPAHNYQVAAIYVPTGTGKEHQTLFTYDARHRLTDITQQVCTISTGHSCSSTVATGSDVYVFDENDNRTRVNEANGAGSLDRYYCYDALERVITTRSAAGCSSGLLETYTYDDSGNRLTAPSTTYTYDDQGQLATCSPSCTVAYDTAGRTTKLLGWAFEYDGQGRMTRACQNTTDCSGLNNEVEFNYDGEGHRTRLRKYDAGSSTAVATWDFRYQGDAIVEEKLTDAAHPTGSTVRRYVVDGDGTIVKVIIPAGETGAGTYLVTWNGHGDALALWRIETSGSLTLANSYTYSTWGGPVTTTHNGIADLGFRFLYLGKSDVHWDNLHGLALHYMHARHYSASIGRFLQPDPAGLDDNLYVYADSNPTSGGDPMGTFAIRLGGCGLGCQGGSATWTRPRVPNPWGRPGSPAHQLEGARAADRLEMKGWRATSGRGAGLPERKYGKRYPDLVLERDIDRIAIQVGRLLRNGQPVARERAALADLRASGYFRHVFFISYKVRR